MVTLVAGVGEVFCQCLLDSPPREVQMAWPLFCRSNQGLLLSSHKSRPTLRDPMDCIVRQAPLSMGLSRQESCSGLSFPSPGDLPHPGIEPGSPALAGRFFASCATTEVPRRAWGKNFAPDAARGSGHPLHPQST